VHKATASSSMALTVLPGVAMKPHKSTGLTILNWTKYSPSTPLLAYLSCQNCQLYI